MRVAGDTLPGRTKSLELLRQVAKQNQLHLSVKSRVSNQNAPLRNAQKSRRSGSLTLVTDVWDIDNIIDIDGNGTDGRAQMLVFLDYESRAVASISVVARVDSVTIATGLYDAMVPKRVEAGWPEEARFQFLGALKT